MNAPQHLRPILTPLATCISNPFQTNNNCKNLMLIIVHLMLLIQSLLFTRLKLLNVKPLLIVLRSSGRVSHYAYPHVVRTI